MNQVDQKKRVKLLYFLAILGIIFVIILATLELFPLIVKLSNESTRQIAKEEIADMGMKGIFLVILMQVIQIVVAVIPGQPMEIISGMLYGTWGGMLVCLVGIFIGTLIVFALVRGVGIKFIRLFFKQESIDKIRKSKIYQNPQKFELFMLIIFCIPMIPKDIFIYLGGISPARTGRFLTIATIGRIPGLFLTVFAGNRLSQGNMKIVVILTIVILLLGLIGYYVIPKLQNKWEKEEN